MRAQPSSRLAHQPRVHRRRSLPQGSADGGAVAVEFALLLPLLMLFLFGIIQYGYGLFQLQTFSSTVADSAKNLQSGITSCADFTNSLTSLAGKDGLDGAAISDVHVQWLDESGAPTSTPLRYGYAKMTASYTPFKLGIPFIPFPNQITRSQTVLITDIINTAPGAC